MWLFDAVIESVELIFAGRKEKVDIWAAHREAKLKIQVVVFIADKLLGKDANRIIITDPYLLGYLNQLTLSSIYIFGVENKKIIKRLSGDAIHKTLGISYGLFCHAVVTAKNSNLKQFQKGAELSFDANAMFVKGDPNWAVPITSYIYDKAENL